MRKHLGLDGHEPELIDPEPVEKEQRVRSLENVISNQAIVIFDSQRQLDSMRMTLSEMRSKIESHEATIASAESIIRAQQETIETLKMVFPSRSGSYFLNLLFLCFRTNGISTVFSSLHNNSAQSRGVTGSRRIAVFNWH